MRNHKWLLFGGSIMFLAALISLFLDKPLYLSAGSEVCNGSCSITETTVNDFARGTFNYTGIRNIGDGEVQLLPIGLTSPWITDTYRLPGARSELAAVIYRNPNTYDETIYAIGGYDALSNLHTEIYTATTTMTGGIAAPGWITVTQSPLTIPLAAMQAVISTTANGGFLYVLGGKTTTFPFVSDLILYKPINISGTLPFGAWTTTPLPPAGSPAPLSSLQAFVRNGYLYVVAGADDVGNPTSNIYRAQIQNDGSLSNWVADTPSIMNRDSFASALWNSENSGDWLYLIGGRNDKNHFYGEAEVEYTNFEGIGLHSSFTDTTVATVLALPAGRLGHTAVQAGGVLYTIGGDGGGAGTHGITNTVLTGLIDSTSGKVGQLVFPWITTNPLGAGRAYHASVISRIGEIYVIGGYDENSTVQATVYHGATAGTGYNFAPAGNYTSRIIDRANNRAISDIKVNAILTPTSGMTLSLQYRVGDNQSAVLGAPWKTLGNFPNDPSTIGLTRTFSLQSSDVYSSQIQYRAFFTTAYTNTSPILNAFQINYPAPPPPPVTLTPTLTPPKPEFIIASLSAPPESGIQMTQTITYSVLNNTLLTTLRQAPVAASNVKAPVRTIGGRKIPPPPSVPLRSSPSGASAPKDDPPPNYMFWVSFYADPIPAPTNPISLTNTMHCIDYNNPLHPPGEWQPFIYWNPTYGSELTRTPKEFYAKCSVPANTKNFYAQIDTCDPTDTYCQPYGYVLEQSEIVNPPNFTTNIIGPAAAGTTITKTVSGPGSGFLPIIGRQ